MSAAPAGHGGARLRDAQPGDLPALQAIRAAAFAPIFTSFRGLLGPAIAAHALATAEADQAALLERIANGEGGARLLVLEQGGRAVGFVAFTMDAPNGVGEVGLNAVHPDCAGRGLGTWMYGRVIEAMRAAGMRIAVVSTGGDAAHAPARRAYERVGFAAPIPAVTLHRPL